MSENERQCTPRQHCCHCGNSVVMEIVANHSRVKCDDDSSQSNHSRNCGIVYELLSCPACEAVTLRSYYRDERMPASDIKFKTLYPAINEDSVGLSRSMKQSYSAARRFRTIDADAYRVMLRRLAVIHECNRSKPV
jgi:hypothetical protein